MQVTSPGQHQATTNGQGALPAPEQMRDGLWSVPIRMPGEFLGYTLCTVAVDRDGDVHVIDPGSAGTDNLDALTRFLQTVDRDLTDVRSIVVTHAHPDHLGLAGELRRVSGARLILSDPEQTSLRGTSLTRQWMTLPEPWGVPAAEAATFTRLMESTASGAERREPDPVTADHLLIDGQRLTFPGFDWQVVATPGHTPGHICLVDQHRGLLFSGDHVLPNVFPGIGLGDGTTGNPVADYLRSLDRLAPFDGLEVIPGHG